VTVASWANRLFSVAGEFGMNYNRSDGLVKQQYAQIPGAPRTFVNKCHGGFDSLVTSREAFEIASRFFFGNIRARLRMIEAKVTRGKDFFGKSEFFFGVSVKPRRVDFELFHQSPEAENCYGPFSLEDQDRNVDFREETGKLAFAWADDRKLIWEGHFDSSQVIPDPSTDQQDSGADQRNPSTKPRDMVFRLDFYVGERDLLGVGFSDNVVFRKQYYVRVLMDTKPLQIYCLTGEEFIKDGRPAGELMTTTPEGWQFQVEGTGFNGTFQIEIDLVPPDGYPQPLSPIK
jgi:hypothetical protein